MNTTHDTTLSAVLAVAAFGVWAHGLTLLLAGA
jgi:hypothetical protein